MILSVGLLWEVVTFEDSSVATGGCGGSGVLDVDVSMH